MKGAVQYLENKVGNFLGYFITLYILLITTSPFFGNVRRDFAAGLIIFLFLISALKGIKVFNQKVFLFMGLTYILIIIQGIFWGFTILAAVVHPLLNIFLPYLILLLVGISFFKYLFNIIYFTAIYTLFLWFIQSVFPAVDRFFLDAADTFFKYGWDAWPRSLIFYTTGQYYAYNSQLGIYRNSGIFHEPGAYSIYLIIAIIINTVITKNPIHKRNLFLSFVVLTTFSTVGYIMLFLLALYSVPKLKINPVFKITTLITLLLLIYYSYNTSYFLRDKVETQYITQTKAVQEGKVTRGRIYSALISLKIALSYPISGRNILVASNVEEEIGEGGSFGYGFIGLMASYGLIFAGIYLWFLYKGLKNLCLIYNFDKKYALIFFIIINLGLLTQAFMLNATIVMFFLIGMLIPKKSFYVQPKNITDYGGHGLIR